MNLAAHLISDEKRSPILGLQLNGTSTSFATATDQGWAVYRTHPLQRTSRRESAKGSLRLVLPLELSNILFLVGGPPSPLYSPNKVIVWDEHLGQAVCELEFREEVNGLAARRDRLVVLLKKRVVLFVLGKGGLGIWREGVYETTNNPKGLVALGTEIGSTLLAFPGRQPGQVQIVNLPPLTAPHEMPPLPPAPSHDPTSAPYPSVSIILAHTTSLAALSCTPSGALLATASSKGTLIRVWDTSHARLVKELRRGSDEAEVFGIAIRTDGEAVAVSSDKGTVHVWDLKMTKEEYQKKRSASASSVGEATETTRSKQFSMLKPYLPKYFSSEWSQSQFRLPPPAPTASRLPFSLSSSTAAAAAAGASALSSGVGSGSTAPPTIEDDVCICAWIEVETEAPVGPADASGASTAGRADSSSRSNTSATTMGKGSARSIPSRLGEKRTEHQLVALTHSGRWFRISLLGGGGGGGGGAEGGTGGRSKDVKDDAFGLGRDSTTDCRLEEYRQFGKQDGW